MDRDRAHLSSAELLQAIDGELGGADAARVSSHLDACWSCRGRRDRIAATIGDFTLYRERLLSPDLPPPPAGRARFLAALAERAARGDEQRSRWMWGPRALSRHPRLVASIALLVIAVWVAGAPAAAAFWTVLRSLASGVTSAPETPVPRLVRTGDTDLPREVRAPEPAGPAAPVREKAPANLVALEIEALWRLHQVGALAGDDIAVRRDGRGLSIEARVDTPERKAGLQRALSSLADAGVHVRVETFQEIADRAGSPSPRVVVQDLVAVADTAPAAALLAAHFAAQFGSASDERIPGAARDFSRRVLQQARHATLGVFALRRICEGVPPAALEEAGGAARVTHQVLVREYAGAIEAAGAALVRDLQTVFPPPADPVEAPDQLSLQALTTSASRLEEGLQHAFAVQAGGAAPPLPDGRHLLGLARGVERAAGRIRQHTCQ